MIATGLEHVPPETECHRAENARLSGLIAGTHVVVPRDDCVAVIASLAATISTLERTKNARKAVASDQMFWIMLDDYRKALRAGRAMIAAQEASDDR